MRSPGQEQAFLPSSSAGPRHVLFPTVSQYKLEWGADTFSIRCGYHAAVFSNLEPACLRVSL